MEERLEEKRDGYYQFHVYHSSLDQCNVFIQMLLVVCIKYLFFGLKNADCFTQLNLFNCVFKQEAKVVLN